MIKAGDKVICVGAEFSTCPLHNEERLGTDPHPEMAGKVFAVLGTANWAKPVNCNGVITLSEVPGLWCVGCFRKIEKAEDNFLASLFSKPSEEKELV